MKAWRPIAALVAALFLGLSPASAAGDLAGRVVAVADGDTLTLLTDSSAEVRVRLTEIDAPEGGQAWGARSRQLLSSIVSGQRVRVVEQGKDRYGRTLGRLYLGERDVSAEMVGGGGAWAYLAHLTDRRMIGLEAQAKAARRGLWAMPASETMPPWEWRQARAGTRVAALPGPRAERDASTLIPGPRDRPPEVRQFSSAAPSSRAGASSRPGSLAGAPAVIACGTKRYCRQMTSCAEARAYLRQCGLATIDGDGDGAPCETLC